MKPDEFKVIYLSLAKEYAGRMATDNDTVDSWYARLNDIPADTLRKAIDGLADNPDFDPRYVPNAIQLRRYARKMSGANDFASLPDREDDDVVTPDVLRGTMFELTAKFYNEGELDSIAWDHLASGFRNKHRYNAAKHVDEMYSRLEAME